MNLTARKADTMDATTAGVDELTTNDAVRTAPKTRRRPRRLVRMAVTVTALAGSVVGIGAATATPASAAVGGGASCASNYGWGVNGSINVYPGRAAYGTIAVEYLVIKTSSGWRYAGPSARAVTDGYGNWYTDRVGGARLFDNRVQLTAPWSGYTYMVYEFLVNQSGQITGQGYYTSYYIDPWTPRRSACVL